MRSGNRDYRHKALTISQKNKRLGAYSGNKRREQEARSRRNLEIKITSKVSDLALTSGAEGVSQE